MSYQIVNVSLKLVGKIADTYNNQMIAFSEIPNRIFIAFKMGLEKLFVYNTDFMPLFMTILFAIFVVMFLALLISLKIKTNSKFAIIALFFSAIIASQTHIILAKTFTTHLYVEYYGLLFLRVLIVMLVFKCIAQFIRTQILLQSLAFALSCVFIWICVVQDLEGQKVHKLAMDREFRLINHIVDRIEQSEGFSYNKQYYGLMFGQVKKTTKDFISNSFQPWSFKNVFTYTMPKDIFAKYGIYYDFLMQEDYTKEQIAIIQTLILRLHKAGILGKLQPYPHKDSVVVFEDIIVFVASKGDLDEIKQKAKELQ